MNWTNAQTLFSKSKEKNLNTEARLEYLIKAIQAIPEEQNDSLSLAILSNISYCHYKLNQIDSSHYYDKRILKKSLHIDSHLYSARASRDIAIFYENKEMYDSAFFYHTAAKNHFLTVSDSTQVGRRLLRLGIIQQNQNDHFGSKETLTEALSFFSKKNNRKHIAAVYNSLGTNNIKLTNYTDAIGYYNKAIEKTDHPEDLPIYKNNLAAALIQENNYSQAILILKEILVDSSIKEKPTEYARVLDNLAYAKWRNNENNSGHAFMEALQIRKAKNDKRGQIASYTNLGEYFSQPNPYMAKKYLDTVIQLSKQLKIPKAETDALKLLMDLEPKNTIVKDRYIFLKDSLYEQELKVKTQFAKMKYDDEQEKQRILILEAETAQKQADLAEQKVQKILFLSLSGLLLIGGTFFYYVLRLRHKKEKLQEVYITEKRISKKIHDELANDIYGVMTTMEHSKTFQKETVLDTLESIYNRTRDISHETGDIDTENYQDELKKLLSQFRNDDTAIAVKGLNDVRWDKVTEEKRIILYRILNELLVNMKKHSGASLVSFTFKVFKRELKIDYSDNGKGTKIPIEKGAGLLNTENRIKNSDGTFSFESEPGKGVRIRCTFPI